MNKRGKIITLSGLDRRGKTTQAKLLSESLNAIYMKFPSDESPMGRIVRSILNETYFGLYTDNNDRKYIIQKNPKTFQAINFAEKMQQEPYILSILNNGQNIVMDRYDLDSYVYAVADGCDPNWVLNMVKLLIPSDICVYIKGKALERNDKKDVYEKDNIFMETVENIFDLESTKNSLNIANLVTFNTFDYTIDEIHHKLKDMVNMLLENDNVN